MKIVIEGHIRATHWGDPNTPLEQFSFAMGPATDSDWQCAITQHTIRLDVDLPDREQLTVSVIKALREKKERAYQEAAKTALEVDEQIQQLLAITNEVKEALE